MSAERSLSSMPDIQEAVLQSLIEGRRTSLSAHSSMGFDDGFGTQGGSTGASNHGTPTNQSSLAGDDDVSYSATTMDPSPKSVGVPDASPIHGRPHIVNRMRSVSLNSRFGGRSTANITQQQMNKKRQRATPDQLVVLEEAFSVNANPNAKMREAISNEISMTERSVQIWFQNRRAKTKSTFKKGLAFDDLMPHAHRHPYDLAMRPGMPARTLTLDLASSHGGYGHEVYQGTPHGSMTPQPLMQQQGGPFDAYAPPVKAVITRLNVRSLTIGSWRRVSCNAMDLVCYFAQNEPKFTHYINSGSAGFKIEFSVGSVQMIDLKPIEGAAGAQMARLTIKLLEPPVFLMEVATGGWKQCTDFTEQQQASTVLTHSLVGPAQALRDALIELSTVHTDTAELITLDENTSAGMRPSVLPPRPLGPVVPTGVPHASDAAAMVAPMGNPAAMAAQAALLGQRQPAGTGFPPGGAAEIIQQGPPRQAHRRTRSRSAPIAVDFSQFLAGDRAYANYHTGQTSSRAEPYHRDVSAGWGFSQANTPFQQSNGRGPGTPANNLPHGLVTNMSAYHGAKRFDFGDSVYTPSSTATPSYIDGPGQHATSWYDSSYCGTPLPHDLSMQPSAVSSPMLAQSSQFDGQMAAAAAAAAGLALTGGADASTHSPQEAIEAMSRMLLTGSAHGEPLPAAFNAALPTLPSDNFAHMGGVMPINQSMPDLGALDTAMTQSAMEMPVGMSPQHQQQLQQHTPTSLFMRSRQPVSAGRAMHDAAYQASLHSTPVVSRGNDLGLENDESVYARSVAAAAAAAAAAQGRAVSGPMPGHPLNAMYGGQVPLDPSQVMDFDDLPGLSHLQGPGPHGMQ